MIFLWKNRNSSKKKHIKELLHDFFMEKYYTIFTEIDENVFNSFTTIRLIRRQISFILFFI